ncbi:methylated-DNA--[protein]-cysteine S-methyltransferase [Pedobacter flavus]|uniref:Methylated-DNA--[protein]-cysteine S-methyltransferase n=1 Tax=Pedobacter flavus TaxID=3113906 RepID=A0ABU7H3Z1_9SPHI|nr:methylated-DNA--[protein]-cysteine S-methyltransferase [Pedobacter sp. VNH31]MEE1885974.1 methylated-DNA--[protein]-cysteine S-methyltransferase [Pedobacter sp. VNH31]
MAKEAYLSVLQTPIGDLKILGNENFIHTVSFTQKYEEIFSENDITRMAYHQLKEYFEGTRFEFDFPFSQSGTPFQQEVWRKLLEVEYAQTKSYKEFSSYYPLAIRAIAAANGKNNLAIIVPCHRIIGNNGKLVGYAGGLERKRWLLEHEIKIKGIGQATFNF